MAVKMPFDQAHVYKAPDNETGKWLHDFAWSHCVHLSFKERVGVPEAERRFDWLVAKMWASEHKPVAWFLLTERRFPGDNPHLHSLMMGTESFKMYKWQQEWYKTQGESEITPYDPTGNMCNYLGGKIECVKKFDLVRFKFSDGFPSLTVPHPVEEAAIGKTRKKVGRPMVVYRPGFLKHFREVLERLDGQNISRRQAARELNIGYATLKRFLDARKETTDGSKGLY